MTERAPLPLEASVATAVQWLKLGVEALGACVIAVGIIATLLQLARGLARRETIASQQCALPLRATSALALEFQLGADILSTAIAPNQKKFQPRSYCHYSDWSQLLSSHECEKKRNQ
jgi:uncharacterized membrane protein